MRQESTTRTYAIGYQNRSPLVLCQTILNLRNLITYLPTCFFIYYFFFYPSLPDKFLSGVIEYMDKYIYMRSTIFFSIRICYI